MQSCLSSRTRLICDYQARRVASLESGFSASNHAVSGGQRRARQRTRDAALLRPTTCGSGRSDRPSTQLEGGEVDQLTRTVAEDPGYLITRGVGLRRLSGGDTSLV